MRHYVDTCLPFSFRQGSALFQHLSDAVCHIINDVIGVDLPSKINDSFLLLQQKLTYLDQKKIEASTSQFPRNFG